MKLIKRTPKSWWTFYCPGCKAEHAIHPRYVVTGENEDRPTVTPSLSISWKQWQFTEKSTMRGLYQGLCHVTITDGQLKYSSGCTHNLRGQTVDMVEIVP
jgi:hypothetical protein